MPNSKWLLITVFPWIAFSSIAATSLSESASAQSQTVGKQMTLQSSAKTISTALELKTRPRVALALGGGGCKCAAEIGVLRILEANKIPIDYIIGTSTGATIGAMYAAGITVDEIQKFYVDDIVQKAMIPRLGPRLIFFPLQQAKRDFTKKGEAGITNGAHFKTLLNKTLPAKFSDLKIPFSAVTTDLITGKTFVFSSGNLPIAVQASNCLPPMFEPMAVDDKLLVDGALRANVPANWARKSGADIVIAVNVDPVIKEEDPKKFIALKEVLIRVSDIGLHELDMREQREADIMIQPDTNGINLMTGNKQFLKEAIKNGESATLAALPKIKLALQERSIINIDSGL